MDAKRQHVLDEMKRTAAANGGRPLGEMQFARETSIRGHEWRRYWPRISDLQKEAGFEPNTKKEAIPTDVLFTHLALLTRELGKRPTASEIGVKRNADPNFPGFQTFLRLGDLKGITRRLAEWCRMRPEYSDVATLLFQELVGSSTSDDQGRKVSVRVRGSVYLLKDGKHYKIGRTNSIGRRERELDIQLPRKPTKVHVIQTDDPEGIEAYWHKRFADKRREGSEWFVLSADDVAAFRWRKFM